MMMRLPRINIVGTTVYRRRAHLVVWGDEMLVTIAPWPLYWMPSQCRTFARVSCCGNEGLWLPVVDLIGHWDWFTGEISGARILSGYGPYGCVGPLTEQISVHPKTDPDTGCNYWYSDRGRLIPRMPDPMAHT